VYSFAADSQMTIYAGTSKGVFYGVDFDTGCWHSRSPQLEMPIRDICLARMNSSGMPPDVYAATDSGVYHKSIQTTASGVWNRLFTLKTFAVEVIDVSDDHVIYAGTVDGLWKYERSTPVTGRRIRLLPQPAAGRGVMYSLDGRVVPQNNGNEYRGVYITVEKNCKRGVSRVHSVVH
jgi:ligand-binding sensor domain-containing protein